MLPDFIGVGAQRAGTTWVHNCLKQHPELSLPEKKETQFFNAFYERGFDWYESRFVPKNPSQLIGEITPDYMYSERAMQRIVKHIPDVKVFLVLRNPFERAYSSYLLFKNNKSTDMTFREACEKHGPVVRYSLYAEAIKRIFEYIPSSKVKIMLYDDLKNNNELFLDELYAFLGVSKGVRPDNIKVRYNKVMFASLQKYLIRNNMSWIIDGLKGSVLNNYIRKSYRILTEKKTLPISQDDYEYLEGIFKEDILATQKLIKRDLAFWLKK